MIDPRTYDNERRGKMGLGTKVLLGGFGCAATGMVLLICFSFAFSAFLDRTVAAYTDDTPIVPRTVVATPEETEAIKQRTDDYSKALDDGKAEEPLVINEHDVNVLLGDSLKDNENAAVDIELLPGQVRAQVSLRLTQKLPLGPWSRDLTGRYLNGIATFDAAVHNGKLDLRLAAFEVKGRPLPETVLDILRNEIDKSGVLEKDDVQDFLKKVGAVDFQSGQVTITPPLN